ncbi:hypothetical protein RCL_jg21528.t1 [Rhizophagus clarus]|uniref:Uncharacterized protein n=1 Tax=Rhizophagus clarus TaxID=94130 RepID=A0A8H3KZA5_9GLOM|nr:hypothetical protein RCL_jg21528.t1 [Rhizophagus clarus]
MNRTEDKGNDSIIIQCYLRSCSVIIELVEKYFDCINQLTCTPHVASSIWRFGTSHSLDINYPPDFIVSLYEKQITLTDIARSIKLKFSCMKIKTKVQ